MKRLWLMLLVCCWLLPAGSQTMSVEQYARLKRPIWNRSKTTVDKQMALLDFYTGEKGFTFNADGKQDVAAEEGDGKITLKLPHKTQFVIIKHPDYGQLTWRVPKKVLKRKKHYCATLVTTAPEKEYKLQRQWVVFNIMPENTIVTIDSTLLRLRERTTTYYLPIGWHKYEVEAPFYEAVKDSFQLTDSAKVEINVNLQPVYSYLTVRTPWRSSDIRIDGQTIAMEEGTSQRLMAGHHTLAVFLDGTCCYETAIVLDKAEKKTIEITFQDLIDYFMRPKMKTDTINGEPVLVAEIYAPVTLKAADEGTEIWVDREKMGNGQWSGKLVQGYHLITTRKDSVESMPVHLWITDEFPQEINLAVPQTSQGMVNIFSNAVGADIFIDKLHVGTTPCVVKGLLSTRNYTICLKKKGYKDVKKTIRPKGNDLIDLRLTMKKHKTKSKK